MEPSLLTFLIVFCSAFLLIGIIFVILIIKYSKLTPLGIVYEDLQREIIPESWKTKTLDEINKLEMNNAGIVGSLKKLQLNYLKVNYVGWQTNFKSRIRFLFQDSAEKENILLVAETGLKQTNLLAFEQKDWIGIITGKIAGKTFSAIFCDNKLKVFDEANRKIGICDYSAKEIKANNRLLGLLEKKGAGVKVRGSIGPVPIGFSTDYGFEISNKGEEIASVMLQYGTKENILKRISAENSLPVIKSLNINDKNFELVLAAMISLELGFLHKSR